MLKTPRFFRTRSRRKLPLPLFFPDATRAVVKSLDAGDIQSTRTLGILVNTWHLYQELGRKVLKSHGGVAPFMGWEGAIISDSGGFQVMSLAKSGVIKAEIIDKGIAFQTAKGKKKIFTPEESIKFQFELGSDLLVVLDDFTLPGADEGTARQTVERTIHWAERCRHEFDCQCEKRQLPKKQRPYLVGVVQGGDFLKLRQECAERLVQIGFDGLGYGGWPLTVSGEFNYDVARRIVKDAPEGYLLYGLGIGKPEEIVGCVDLGFHIFDCVLPTRDARHKRLYVYNAKSIEKIDIRRPDFYSYFSPAKERYYADDRPVSTACDCPLCSRYSRAYLHHLFRIGDFTAGRLASIHNLRFYSLLMEKIRALTPRVG